MGAHIEHFIIFFNEGQQCHFFIDLTSHKRIYTEKEKENRETERNRVEAGYLLYFFNDQNGGWKLSVFH